jgi:hypothetical protein
MYGAEVFKSEWLTALEEGRVICLNNGARFEVYGSTREALDALDDYWAQGIIADMHYLEVNQWQ